MIFLAGPVRKRYLYEFLLVVVVVVVSGGGELTIHNNRVHLKLTPFECHMCDMKFSSRNILRVIIIK